MYRFIHYPLSLFLIYLIYSWILFYHTFVRYSISLNALKFNLLIKIK
nr:MAG TPA: hypothetical protein [Caudoviricetes sp.]